MSLSGQTTPLLFILLMTKLGHMYCIKEKQGYGLDRKRTWKRGNFRIFLKSYSRITHRLRFPHLHKTLCLIAL